MGPAVGRCKFYTCYQRDRHHVN